MGQREEEEIQYCLVFVCICPSPVQVVVCFSRFGFSTSSQVYEVTGLGDQVDKSSCLGFRVYESGLRMGSSRASKNETRGARD